MLQFYRRNKPTGILAIAVYRFGNLIYYHVKVPIVRHLLLLIYAVLDNVIVKIICNAEFPAKCRIGKDLRLPHGANGIIIHSKVHIGNSCTLFHQITIGESNEPGKAPWIGNNVKIGAGAKVLGDIKIYNNTQIGANAVVLNDVPEYNNAVGIPAVNKERKRKHAI